MRSVRKLVSVCVAPAVRQAARAYCAGPQLSDALRVCRWLSEHGLASTVGFWNRQGEPPHHIAGEYASALTVVKREGLDCQIAIKAPPLQFSTPLLADLLTQAARAGTRLHFDSMSLEAAEPTFQALAALKRAHARLGCTLPGRWRRSVADADWAIGLGLQIRVVKGQWPDHCASELDPSTGFLTLIDRLAGRAAHVLVATHDAALAERAVQRLKAAGTPCELELLLGLPLGRVAEVARAAAVPIRLYVPFGQASLPYGLADMRRRPGVLAWFMRDLVRGHSTVTLLARLRG